MGKQIPMRQQLGDLVGVNAQTAGSEIPWKKTHALPVTEGLRKFPLRRQDFRELFVLACFLIQDFFSDITERFKNFQWQHARRDSLVGKVFYDIPLRRGGFRH